MSIQSSVSRPAAGVAGLAADASNEILSGYFVPNKYVSVAVGASDSQVYSVTITPDGGSPIVASFTAGVSTTTALITAGLVSAINTAAGAYVAAVGTNTPFTIEGKNGRSFTSSYSAGTGTLTETVVVAGNATAPAGVLLVIDERAAYGSSDYAVRLPKATGDVTALAFGVTTDTVAHESATHGFGMVDCMREGRMFVTVEEAVTAGDAAFVRFAAGSGGSQLGSFRKSADTSTAVALPNAKFLTDGSAAGLAIVQVDVK